MKSASVKDILSRVFAFPFFCVLWLMVTILMIVKNGTEWWIERDIERRK